MGHKKSPLYDVTVSSFFTKILLQMCRSYTHETEPNESKLVYVIHMLIETLINGELGSAVAQW